MTLPKDAQARKEHPIARGLLDYFPDACAEVAHVSFVANEQHNPGEPMHWAKEKSTDEADALVRHLLERGSRDSDGLRHSAKVAWRGLALLQREIEAEAESREPRLMEKLGRGPITEPWVHQERAECAISGCVPKGQLAAQEAKHDEAMVPFQGEFGPIALEVARDLSFEAETGLVVDPDDEDITTTHIGEVLG